MHGFFGVRRKLKNKLVALVIVAILPFLCATIYLIFALRNYSDAYDKIVGNMIIANSYNLNFKEEMDENIYKMVVSNVTFESIGEYTALQNPYELISDLRNDFMTLTRITRDKDSRDWLQTLLRNIDTLEDRMDDIRDNLEEGGHYDQNLEMLDNNIYILTELIQDDIQYYIYYQTKSMEQLKANLNQQIHQLVIICIILLVFIVAGVIISTIWMANSITRPVQELCNVTARVSQGDFSARTEVKTRDEIAQLAGSINNMTEDLEVMVSQIRENEEKMHRAELRLLQEQINPHFLYNTLDTIVWLIEMDSSEQAVDMVVSLSSFFRLVLSHGKELISLKDEERHIRSYLEIQQVRYHDILDYEIQMKEELYPYQIQKMTLQPLVENALYHGIKYKRAKGKITIRGERVDDEIHLYVIDNGVGMEPEELERLRHEITRPCKETAKGFGLANVNERLRMYFGEKYGMRIESEKGSGTTVKLVIPARLLASEEEVPT